MNKKDYKVEKDKKLSVYLSIPTMKNERQRLLKIQLLKTIQQTVLSLVALNGHFLKDYFQK